MLTSFCPSLITQPAVALQYLSFEVVLSFIMMQGSGKKHVNDERKARDLDRKNNKTLTIHQVSLETDGKFLAVLDDNVAVVEKESSLTKFILDIKDG